MKNIFLFLFLFSATLAFSQNDIGYTHFAFNRLAYNPAFAGGENTLAASALYRNQWWSGIDGAPKSLSIVAHTPLGNIRHGLGIQLSTDKIGFYNRQDVDLSYSYRILSKGDKHLSLGINGRLGFNQITWNDAQGLSISDQLIGGEDESRFSPNFGAGIYYTTPKFYVGAALPQILKNTFYLKDNGTEDGPRLTTYVMAGLTLPIGENIDLLPGAIASINGGAPFDLDINVNLLFFEKFMAGLSYRLEDSIDGLLQYRMDNGLRLGIGVDFTTSALNKATTGSYELMVGYVFPCESCKIDGLRYFE